MLALTDSSAEKLAANYRRARGHLLVAVAGLGIRVNCLERLLDFDSGSQPLFQQKCVEPIVKLI